MAGAFTTVSKRCLQILQCHILVTNRNIWKYSYVLVGNAGTNYVRKYLSSASQTSYSTETGIQLSTTNSFNTVKELSLENNERKHRNVEQNKWSDGGIPPYIKLKDDDTLVSKTMIFINSKKNRNTRTEILLEGHRLINEAIKSGVHPKLIFFSRIEDAKKICWPELDFKMYKVSYSTLKLWSSLKTSPGVLGIFNKPDINAIQRNDKSLPLIIVCDNIRNPGNLGSILRVAAGVGCKNVLFTKGCVDLWDSKVLRSGAGAHFALPVQQDCSWEEISEKFMDDETTVVLADNHSIEEGENTIERDTLLKDDLALNSYAEDDFSTTVRKAQKPNLDMKPFRQLRPYWHHGPLLQYHKIDYSGAWMANSSIVLVLGGETEGLSQAGCELAQNRGGIRVHIPLYNKIESLNASTALGVIAFEMRRQYDEWSKKIEQMPANILLSARGIPSAQCLNIIRLLKMRDCSKEIY